jgi:protein-S-isoprenylcysteine O-methyltransferase Ste14
MARLAYLLYGIVAYFIFFGTFLYLIAFTGNLPWVPLTVDQGGQFGSAATALVVNIGLIAIFGLQHSIMARPGFKVAWVKTVPAAIERSTYVVFASIALILLFAFWRPIPTAVWEVGDGAAAKLLWILFGLGWAIVLISTFLINHFELFGLKQVWANLQGTSDSEPVFQQPLFYRLVRHPIYAGFFLAFWATPYMTVGHLILAVGMSIYMLIGIRYEEGDLLHIFGKNYEEYRKRVGMLLPRLGRGG